MTTDAARAARAAERLALQLVPARDRDALLGDLAEEGCAGRDRFVGIVSVAASYQAEPWRDDRTRLGILLLFAASLALLRLLPIAAQGLGTIELEGMVWRGAARFWANGPAIAATAAGLLVGRAPLIPDHAASARWHLVGVLALATIAGGDGWTRGALEAALLVVAALVGSAARTAPPPASAA